TYELRIGIQLQQLVLKRRELEEIIFFANGLGNLSASRTRITRLRPIHIQLVRHAILPGESPLEDEPAVATQPEQMLNPLLVPLFSSADVVIIRNPHPLPQPAKLRRNFIGILLWSFPGSLRSALNLLPMLIGASKKKSLRPQHPLPPRNRVAGNG